MAMIESTYTKFLKGIPEQKITTLSPRESQEILMQIATAFRKKIDVAHRRQKLSWYFIRHHFDTMLGKQR
ncbi:MAG: hypothetical protein E7011_02860 [Alphaproteobacteria bacterium]|nr:hypothetical protein [Alphaproteobacteria bacterium]